MAANDSKKSPHPFDVKTVETLVELMAANDLSEIDLNDGDQRIRLRRGGRAAAVAPQPFAVSAPAAAPPAPAAAPASTPAPAAAPSKPTTPIKSPTPGTFYSKPKPEDPPFVSVGSKVGPATVVCTIEAMKIFNEITADCAGVISKVYIENGQPVEYGTVLFEVEAA